MSKTAFLMDVGEAQRYNTSDDDRKIRQRCNHVGYMVVSLLG